MNNNKEVNCEDRAEEIMPNFSFWGDGVVLVKKEQWYKSRDKIIALLKQEPELDEKIAIASKKLQPNIDEEFVMQVAELAGCLPSFFVGGNDHIIKQLKIKLKQEPCSLCGGSKLKPRKKHCELGVCCKLHEGITCTLEDGLDCEYYIPSEPCPDCPKSQEPLICGKCDKSFPAFLKTDFGAHVEHCGKQSQEPDYSKWKGWEHGMEGLDSANGPIKLASESQEPVSEFVEECRKQLAKAEKDIKDINETDKYSETERAELLHSCATAAIKHHLKTRDRLEAETEANSILAKAKENIANENEKLRTKLQVSNKRLADSENCVLIGDKFLKEYKVKLEAVEGHRDRLIAWCGEYAASPACMMERLQAAEKRADEAEKELEQRLGIIREQEGIIKRWGKEYKVKLEAELTEAVANAKNLDERLTIAAGFDEDREEKIKQLQERNVTLRFQFRELQAKLTEQKRVEIIEDMPPDDELISCIYNYIPTDEFIPEPILKRIAVRLLEGGEAEAKLKSAEGEIEKRKKWMDVELGKYHLSEDLVVDKKGDSDV